MTYKASLSFSPNVQKESKHKMRRESHWQPPLEPILLSQFDHIRYHFEAHVNTTTRIFKFFFPSAKKIDFCDLDKRAIIRPYNINNSLKKG